MASNISPLAQIEPGAEIGADVEIGPFCLVGPQATIGAGTRLDSHVTIIGHTTLGERNHCFPNSVLGAEPQDISYKNSETRLEIGDDNVFREGVTVNRGAEKEDHCTRIGNRSMLMANSHVAHNCHIGNNVILVNGVLLGGHVHVHDGAIVSGNSVVHHFSTLGTLSFVSGGCRVPHDVPPFMLAAGSDDPTIKTINIVGMQRAGIADKTIKTIKRSHRLLFREHKSVDAVRETFRMELGDIFPYELTILLDAIEQQQRGRLGRAREAHRGESSSAGEQSQRRAA